MKTYFCNLAVRSMNYLLILVRQLVYWLLLFAMQRLIFLVYYAKNLRFEGVSLTETILSFYYAFKLDLATACYILVFPFLLLIVQLFTRPSWLNTWWVD